jgi:Ca2+-binding RTX toxin-like protein
MTTSRKETMNKHVAARLVRLAVSAVAVATLVACGAAAALGSGKDKVKDPKLKHGTLTADGTGADDTIALRLAAGRPDTLQVDVNGSVFSFKRADVANIVVDAAGGNDVVRVDETNGVFTDTIPTILDGGDGDDTLAGGTGAETLLGGSGDDVVDGNRGADQAQLGAGDDTFVWDPGDGSDTIEGDSGDDTMRFNGANIAEHVALAANGNHLLFTRDIATITMDTHGVEQVDFNALGGADTVDVGDLSATDVTKVDVDLAATGGGGDGAADQVNVEATNGADNVSVSGGAAAGVHVAGLAAAVDITGSEAANDALRVDALDGDDIVTAAGLAGDALGLTVDGGNGADLLVGSAGNDMLLGGEGDDILLGGPGQDVLDGGPGANVVIQD